MNNLLLLVIGFIIGYIIKKYITSKKFNSYKSISRIYKNNKHIGWMMYVKDNNSTRIYFDDCEISEKDNRLILYRDNKIVGETENKFNNKIISAGKYTSEEEINNILNNKYN